MQRNAPALGEIAYRAAAGEIEPDGDDERSFKVVASDETVDSYGDIVRASGWDLARFRANPVLLFGHRSRELPIGTVDKIGIEGTRLIASGRFAPKGLNPMADSVAGLWRAKMLRASSVGFAPTKMPNDLKDPVTNAWTGFEWVGQELLELSIVPVPANPAALQLARSFGLDEAELRRRLFLPDDDAGEQSKLAAIALERQALQARVALARV